MVRNVTGEIGTSKTGNNGFTGYDWNVAKGVFPKLHIGDMAIELKKDVDGIYFSLNKIVFDSSFVIPTSHEAAPSAISMTALIRIR